MGVDTANGYSCSHYIETYPGGVKLLKPSQRDIWVTNSLGTPGIEVMGSYLYYTPGSQHMQALIAAGCTGVIVRTKMSGIGRTATICYYRQQRLRAVEIGRQSAAAAE